MPKLYAAIKVPFKLDANMQRIDETAAHVAIRESLVNTFVHADYSGRMGIVVCKWQDRIEFRNPGTLRMPIADAYKGWKSDCRNKSLQKMFQFLGYSEKAGSGFPKIFMGTDEQHWSRPFLREDFEFEQTTLTMPTVDQLDLASQSGGDEKYPKSTLKSTLNKTDARIAEVMSENSSVTIPDLVADTKLTREAIKKALKRMKDAGVIRRVGPKNGGHWEVIK